MMTKTFLWITRTELLKLTRQRFLQLVLITLTLACLALIITSPRAYPMADPRFTVQFMQFFVMLGGLLTCSIGAMLPNSFGEFSSTETELATRASLFSIASGRLFATVLNVMLWPFIVSIILMVSQFAHGNNGILQTLGAVILIGLLGVATSLIGSACIGVFLKGTFAIVVSITVWCYLVFSQPGQGLPSINGTMFSLIGDQYCATVLHTEPFFSSSFDSSSWWIAPLSVVVTVAIQFALLALTVAILGRRISK